MSSVAGLLTLLATFATEQNTPGKPTARTAIVVAAPVYREALKPWVERRQQQGYHVQFIDPVAVIGSRERGEAVESLREAIARLVPPLDARGSDSPPDTTPAAFVLLVGDAPAPHEWLDTACLVPAAIVAEKARSGSPKFFPTDNVYGLPDERGVPRLAVGRWPVRRPQELEVQVRKALSYEREQKPGPQRGVVTFLATAPGYDAMLDPLLERMAMTIMGAQLPRQWGIRALYASPRSEYFPGPTETAHQVVRWLEDATPMTLFAGHGYRWGVDFVYCGGRTYPVLDCETAFRIAGDRPGTVLWMSACLCGRFDLARRDQCLAETLVMNPRGPTAVVAGSEETSAWVNLLLCTSLAQDVVGRPPETLGEAVLRIKRAAFAPGPVLLKRMLLSMEQTERPEFLPEDHQYLYNLLGDPTLALHLPRKVEFSAEIAEEAAEQPGRVLVTISGRLADCHEGTASVSLQIDRLAMKEHLPDPAAIDDTEARRAGYLSRFLAANDKTAAEGQAKVADGRFELRLQVPESLAPRVRWLQLYVVCEPGDDGSWWDGVGAQAVRLTSGRADRNLAEPSPQDESLRSPPARRDAAVRPVLFDGNVRRKVW